MSSKLVSLIIPVYNGEKFLRTSVLSALKETSGALEVIVVDDGSTDNSLARISDLDVRIIRHDKNKGIAAALNTGLRAAKSKYFTVLDSDDWLCPTGIASRLNHLLTHPGERVVGGRPAGIVDADGNSLPELTHVLTPGHVIPNCLSLSYMQGGGLYPLLNWLFLFERSLCSEVGEFDESLSSAFDCDYLFRVLRKIEIPLLSEPVALRRWHENNHSHIHGKIGRKLNPSTIAEVIAVCARYGITAGGEFHLWETGYQ